LELTGNIKAFQSGCGRMRIRFVKITFGKTEIVNSVKKVGFTRTIKSANGNDPMIQIKEFLVIIPELNEADMVDAEQNRWRM
jgi:hypothetical protein